MEFMRTDIGWLLLLIPVFVGILLWARRQRSRAVQAWGSEAPRRASRAGRRRAMQALLWLAALVAMIGALAEPRGQATSSVLERRGIDVAFVLDLSRSMLADDVAPTRLRRAVFEMERLLDQLQNDRVALIVFAGTAFTQVPLTTDFALIKNVLRHLEPDDMPYPGSNLAGGLERALEVLAESQSNSRAIVLLTDGEETTGRAAAAGHLASEQGVHIFTLGVGTERGALIPTVDPQGNQDVIRQPDGTPRVSRLDEPGLRALAEGTGGAFYRIGHQGDARAIDQVLSGLEQQLLEERTVQERSHLYAAWLAPAFLFLLVGLWLRDS